MNTAEQKAHESVEKEKPVAEADEVARITVEKPSENKAVRKKVRTAMIAKSETAEVIVAKTPVNPSGRKAVKPATGLKKNTPSAPRPAQDKPQTEAGPEGLTDRAAEKSVTAPISVPATERVSDNITRSETKQPAVRKTVKSRAEGGSKKEGRRGIRLKVSDTDGFES